MKRIISLTFLLLLSHVLLAQWVIKEGYQISFDGKGAEGTFKELQGAINFNPADLSTAKFQVQINAATIETGNDLKNQHARGDKWLNAKAYPTVWFKSTGVEKTDRGYQLVGNLELHGIKKEIVIPFTFTETTYGGLFKGAFSVEREAFGIMGPFFSFMVGDEFKVDLEVPVSKK